MVQNLTAGETRKEPLGNSGLFVCVSRHHAFGTDAVLLADFAAAKKNDVAVDLGTGCGIIPFLWLKDGKTVQSYGVDISSEAVSLCQQAVRDQGLADRFVPICADLNALPDGLPFGRATLVTCNPPYKPDGAGIKSPDPIDCAARHEVACTLTGILEVAYRLLNTSGRLCMCQRPERLCELMSAMHDRGIEPKRLRLVCQKPGKEPWLVLVEGRKGGKTGLRIASPLFVESDGGWSDEMLRIYGSYKTKVDF